MRNLNWEWRLADGSNIKILTEDFDRSLGDVRWSPDSKSLTFTAPSEGYVPLYSVAARGGRIKTLLDRRGVNDYDIEGDHIVFAATTVAHPNELYITNMKGKDEKPINCLQR